MTITIREAHQLANEKFGMKTRLVFFDDVASNDKVILALVNGMLRGSAGMTLANLGMANNYDEAKRIIEDVLDRNKIVDKQTKK